MQQRLEEDEALKYRKTRKPLAPAIAFMADAAGCLKSRVDALDEVFGGKWDEFFNADLDPTIVRSS